MLGGVLERRLWRTLPPYVVWTLAYALLLQGSGTWGALKALLTAGAAAQMYFIAVYLQLTMLTSLLYRLLRWRPLIVYAVTPLSLAAYEVLTAVGIALPILGRLFPMWLVFYVVGLDWERWRARLQGKFRAALVALGACLAIQLVSGFAWLHLGDYNMATTQLKLSSMATSLCVIAVIMLLPASENTGFPSLSSQVWATLPSGSTYATCSCSSSSGRPWPSSRYPLWLAPRCCGWSR